MSDREAAEAAAAAWLARRERDDWNDAAEAELRAWMEMDFGHRAAWLRISHAWKQAESLRTLSSQAPPGTVPAPAQMHVPFYDAAPSHDVPRHPVEVAGPRRFFARHGLKIGVAAAGLAGALALGGYWLFGSSTYRTHIGALEAVPLDDGSRVTLNTDTEIRVSLTERERRVQLEQGEAFFEVTRDPARPFVVEAGPKRIVVLGTRFSVRREAGSVQVVVAEGAVRVEDRGDVSRTRGNGEAVLRAGAVGRAEGDGMRVRRGSTADIEQILSWRTGMLVFDATPLAKAAEEFNRYNARRIVVEDATVADIPVGGSFRAANVEAFVRLIESDFPVVAVRDGNRIRLREKKAGGGT